MHEATHTRIDSGTPPARETQRMRVCQQQHVQSACWVFSATNAPRIMCLHTGFIVDTLSRRLLLRGVRSEKHPRQERHLSSFVRRYTLFSLRIFLNSPMTTKNIITCCMMCHHLHSPHLRLLHCPGGRRVQEVSDNPCVVPYRICPDTVCIRLSMLLCHTLSRIECAILSRCLLLHHATWMHLVEQILLASNARYIKTRHVRSTKNTV